MKRLRVVLLGALLLATIGFLASVRPAIAADSRQGSLVNASTQEQQRVTGGTGGTAPGAASPTATSVNVNNVNLQNSSTGQVSVVTPAPPPSPGWAIHSGYVFRVLEVISLLAWLLSLAKRPVNWYRALRWGQSQGNQPE